MADTKLSSAEGITKYLRSRSISNDDLVKTSNDLLDDNLTVYLPNKRVFILELICERLSDAKFASLRTDYRVWDLLNKSYESLKADPKLRNRTLQTIKAGDAILGALRKDNGPKTKELFRAILTTIHFIRLNVSINNLFDQAIPVLTTLLYTLITLKDISAENGDYFNEIIAFFNTSVTIEKFSKKFTTSFTSNALPVILQTIEFSTDESSRESLYRLIKRVILNKDIAPSIIESFQLLLKSDDLRSAGIVLFFKFIVTSLPKLETPTIERLYSLTLEKFPDTSEDLLEFISSNNRALSSPFLQNIFQKEIVKKSSKNWNLICSVLKLDVDAGLQNAERLMSLLESESYEYSLPVLKEIINSFIKSRLFSDFFQLWFKLLEDRKDSKFRSDRFQKLVSSYIHNLSSTQLIKLIDAFNGQQSNNKYILLSSILQGIFSLKNKQIISDVESLFKPVFELDMDDKNNKDDNLWKLKYQILTVYEELLDDEELLQLIKQAPVTNGDRSPYKFFTFFRIRELISFDLTEVAEKFIDFIALSQENYLMLIEFVFKRWFVLVDKLFSDRQIKKLVNIFLELQDQDLITSVFANDEIFEQRKIMSILLEIISEAIKSDGSAFTFNVLNMIPIQCYPKRLKPVIIESLTNQLLETKKNHGVLNILENLLENTPSFSSKIETDIKEIESIISKNPANDKLFEIVWGNHTRNSKEPSSAKFTSKTIDHVAKLLSDNSIKGSQLTTDYRMAHIILTSKSTDRSQAQKLILAFTTSVKLFLDSLASKSKKKMDVITWVLSAIKDLNLASTVFESLRPSLTKIGALIQDSTDEKSKAPKVQLFLLLCKYSNESTSLEFIESLYIVLRREGIRHDELKEGLLQIFKVTDMPTLNEGLDFCMRSLTKSNDTGLIFEIVTCYWYALSKSNEQSSQFFIRSLSLISLSLNSLSNESLLLVINELKTTLTDRSWLISQYGLEFVIAIISKTIDSKLCLNSKFIKDDHHLEDIFQAVTLAMSSILQFHRFRLSNRHHLIVSVFNSLLRSLTNDPRITNVNGVRASKKSAQSFSRLLSNLCEPSVPASHGSAANVEKLSTTASILKRGLRKHIHVILLMYIHLALKYSYQSEIREALLPGIFNIFDVLSQNELNLVNTSLNHPGRTYYRTLYDEYKKVGKWHTD